MKIENDTAFFSSGRQITVKDGVIGISPDGLSQGRSFEFLADDEITGEEMIELSDYMIAQWQGFRKQWS